MDHGGFIQGGGRVFLRDNLLRFFDLTLAERLVAEGQNIFLFARLLVIGNHTEVDAGSLQIQFLRELTGAYTQKILRVKTRLTAHHLVAA